MHVFYKTIDGKIFNETTDDGYDGSAIKKARKHEIEYLKNSLGEHKFYIVAFINNLGEINGYIPKINKKTNITKNWKFAKRFYKFDAAYQQLNANTKLIGVDS